MKTNFNKKVLLNIAVAVQQYGKLYVTTQGVCYRKIEDAESAVRTTNMIIGEPSEFVGIVEITPEMMTNERLKVYAKDMDAFNALFDNARIPRQREIKGQSGRGSSAPEAVDPNTEAALAELIGKDEPVKEEPVKEEPVKESKSFGKKG